MICAPPFHPYALPFHPLFFRTPHTPQRAQTARPRAWGAVRHCARQPGKAVNFLFTTCSNFLACRNRFAAFCCDIQTYDLEVFRKTTGNDEGLLTFG